MPPEQQVEITMTVRQLSPGQMAFQDMMALSLDVNFFTSEFRLCDVIAEYLANIAAQSHEDPARYANFSSQLINEIVEVAFGSARTISKVDFNLLKNGVCVRICVGFVQDKDSLMTWAALNGPAALPPQHHAYDLLILARAMDVDLRAEVGGDCRITLVADFLVREGVH